MMKSVVLAGVALLFLALPAYAQERMPQIPTEQMTPAQKCDLDRAAQVAWRAFQCVAAQSRTRRALAATRRIYPFQNIAASSPQRIRDSDHRSRFGLAI